ncbi:MAG: hypothetical protein ACR2P1_21150 [Pseudomonadales bacterium]
MFSQPQNRWQAFAVHIGISAIIFVVLAAIIVFIWYPDFLFQTDGGWQGIRLVAGVDFIIGPVLTLIVYKLGKPRLKMDLTLIGLLQIACLTYGMWLVYQQRPLAVIYADERFYTMSEGTFAVNEMDWTAIPMISNGKKPVWIFVDLPEEKEARTKMRLNQLKEGLVHTRTSQYLPYTENVQRVAKLGASVEEVEEHTNLKPVHRESYMRFYPLSARYSDGLLGIDTRDGSVVELLEKDKTADANKPLEKDESAKEDDQLEEES